MQKALRIVTALTVAMLPVLVYSYASGPDPRYTGAPGDQTCVVCHQGTALNGGGGSLALTSSTGATYTSGQQQTFTITVADSKARAYGFQMTARLDSNPSSGQAGDFTAGAQQMVLCGNGSIKGSAGCPSNAPVQFIEHNRPFTTNTITASWTLPRPTPEP